MTAPGRAIELVIFDCDGVLVDSETLAAEVLTEHLAALGLSAVDVADTIARYRGLSQHSCEREIRARCLAEQVTYPADFWSRMQADTFGAFAQRLAPIAGAEKVLQSLQAEGIRFCVASSGDHQKLALTLSHTGLLPYVEGRVFSATEVARGKPAPDLFRYAAEQMGVAPSRCLVVEDSRPGVQAAIAASMRVCGYDPQAQSQEQAVFADLAPVDWICRLEQVLSICAGEPLAAQ